MKIVSNPQQAQFLEFIQSLPWQFDKGGTVIYRIRNEIRVFDVFGTALNVKRFKTPILINRLIYTFFRSSKAQRSFQYALKLKEMGIETPQPVAYILIKKGGLLYDSYYISRQADHNRDFYEFGKGGVEGREHILIAFAGFTADMHKKGVYHKDYSPGNILFKEENGAVKFCVVDINRLRFGDVTACKGCLNFVRLWGQKPFFEIVVRKYAEIRGADPEACLQSALRARKKFWKKFTRKHPWPFVPD